MAWFLAAIAALAPQTAAQATPIRLCIFDEAAGNRAIEAKLGAPTAGNAAAIEAAQRLMVARVKKAILTEGCAVLVRAAPPASAGMVVYDLAPAVARMAASGDRGSGSETVTLPVTPGLCIIAGSARPTVPAEAQSFDQIVGQVGREQGCRQVLDKAYVILSNAQNDVSGEIGDRFLGVNLRCANGAADPFGIGHCVSVGSNWSIPQLENVNERRIVLFLATRGQRVRVTATERPGGCYPLFSGITALYSNRYFRPIEGSTRKGDGVPAFSSADFDIPVTTYYVVEVTCTSPPHASETLEIAVSEAPR